MTRKMTVGFAVIPNYQGEGFFDKQNQSGRQECCLVLSSKCPLKAWKILSLGLQLNPVKAFISVDHGPWTTVL